MVEVNLDDVALYIDGQLVGSVNRGEPLRLAGLPAGYHKFEGVRAGYEPDTKKIVIRAGQEVAVTIRIRHPLPARPEARRPVRAGRALVVWGALVREPLEHSAGAVDPEPPGYRARPGSDHRRSENRTVLRRGGAGPWTRLPSPRESETQRWRPMSGRVRSTRSTVEVLTQLAAVQMEYGDFQSRQPDPQGRDWPGGGPATCSTACSRGGYWENEAWGGGGRRGPARDRAEPRGPSRPTCGRPTGSRMLATWETSPGARDALFSEGPPTTTGGFST